MSITLHVIGKDELVAKFRRVADQLPSLVNDEMKTQMVRLADYVRINKLSGDPLHRRSGRLSRSISGNSSVTGHTVTGTVGSKGVPYAAVHELGLTVTVPAHQRMIKQVFGRPVMPHLVSVRSYSATFPKRAFLHPSMDENRAKILSALHHTVMEAMNAT